MYPFLKTPPPYQ